MSSELLNEIRSFEEESTDAITTAKNKGEEKLAELKALSLEKVKQAKIDAQETQKKKIENLVKQTEEEIVRVKDENKKEIDELKAKISEKKSDAVQTFVKLVSADL